MSECDVSSDLLITKRALFAYIRTRFLPATRRTTTFMFGTAVLSYIYAPSCVLQNAMDILRQSRSL